MQLLVLVLVLHIVAITTINQESMVNDKVEFISTWFNDRIRASGQPSSCPSSCRKPASKPYARAAADLGKFDQVELVPSSP